MSKYETVEYWRSETEKLRKEIQRKNNALKRIKQRAKGNMAVITTADIALKPRREERG